MKKSSSALDPAWRDPKMRPRILAAKKLAEKKPDSFRNPGTWAWEYKNEKQQVHVTGKTNSRSDGTLEAETLVVLQNGYKTNYLEGRFKVVGSSEIGYDEHRIVRNVFGHLNFDGKEATFYHFEPNEEGWFELPLTNYKIGTAKRVSKDWQLPDPPEGLA
jgi:hypothetical protein